MQVIERIKDPLQTMVARDHYETAWAALTHFHLIAQRAPVLFSQVSPVPFKAWKKKKKKNLTLSWDLCARHGLSAPENV